MSKLKVALPANLFSIPQRKFKLDRQSEYYIEDRIHMKQYQMLNFWELYNSFDRIIIFNIEQVLGQQLSDLRHLLREEYESELFMGKNTVLIKMIRESMSSQAVVVVDQNERENLQQLIDLLVGPVILLFTNRDPLEMKQLVESKVAYVPCKIGQSVINDVYIYKGDTTLEPRMTYQFQKCLIPTKISRGQVQITQDTLFLKSGTIVNPIQLEILSKMGMKPIPVGCKATNIYERKECCVYSADVLKYNLNPSVYEAMNNLGALSLECNMVNQLTILAELKKSIRDILIVEHYVKEERSDNIFELD